MTDKIASRSLRTSDHTKIRITRFTTKEDGPEYIRLQQWYSTAKDPTWKPGRNGISIPVDVFAKLASKGDELLETLETEVLSPKQK